MNTDDEKPRGFFRDTSYKKWSKDTTKKHYEGPWMMYYWPLMKFLLLAILNYIMVTLIGLALSYSILLCILCTMMYPYIVATLVPNTIVIPTMDY